MMPVVGIIVADVMFVVITTVPVMVVVVVAFVAVTVVVNNDFARRYRHRRGNGHRYAARCDKR